MDDKTFYAALAGLLHDVGKFAQRAAEGKYIQWNDEAEAEFKYEHALHTDGVVAQIVPEQWRETVRGAAGRHHRPTNHLELVVSLADQLSAGERSDERKDHPKQLQSIFCSLTGLDEPAPSPKYLPLKKLAITSDTIFPFAETNDSHTAYKKLWDDFLAEAQLLKEAHEPTGSLAVYLDSLLNLMQQYTWSIPSAYYQSVPDVSLYDHSRMTGALAACMVDLDDLPTANSAEPTALLVGGDISGIQDFIYTITSGGAASALRGRSLYLQLLTLVIARYLLQKANVPITNLIYAGGGHFFFLAPLNAKQDLLDAQKDISRILLHHHQGDLYLGLAHDEIYADEFSGEKFRYRWDKLQKQLQQKKSRKFSELGTELAKLLFEPKEHGGNKDKMCVVCQREHPQAKASKEDDENKVICPVCRQFEALGKDLRKAEYLTLSQIDTKPLPADDAPPEGWSQVLAHFGYGAKLSKAMPKISHIHQNVLALNDNAWGNVKPTATQSVGRQLLVNVSPIVTQEEYRKYKLDIEDLPPVYDKQHPPIKSFEMMTQQSRGIKRLGVLRMDVDNLGQIIGQGLGNRFTLSRLATLSFNISLFFEGWVEQVVADINGSNDLIYSIYSGGDDLFFVGAWDLMPLLAERINTDLKKFVAGHPEIHVSGGIALIPGKYPLYQAAKDAGKAEDLAKGLRRDGGRKNALNFLGQTMSWEKFTEVQKYQKTLEALVEDKEVPKSLLHHLIQLYTEFDNSRQMQEKKGEDFKSYWGPGQWHSVYSLTRMAKREKNAKEDILKIRDDLSLEKFTNIEWLGLAARWTALLTR